MDDEAKRAILNEIVQYTSLPSIEPHEFTVGDYVEAYEDWHKTRLSMSAARNRLNRLAEKGVLVKRLVLYKDRWCYAYSKAERQGEGRG